MRNLLFLLPFVLFSCEKSIIEPDAPKEPLTIAVDTVGYKVDQAKKTIKTIGCMEQVYKPI